MTLKSERVPQYFYNRPLPILLVKWIHNECVLSNGMAHVIVVLKEFGRRLLLKLMLDIIKSYICELFWDKFLLQLSVAFFFNWSHHFPMEINIESKNIVFVWGPELRCQGSGIIQIQSFNIIIKISLLLNFKVNQSYLSYANFPWGAYCSIWFFNDTIRPTSNTSEKSRYNLLFQLQWLSSRFIQI